MQKIAEQGTVPGMDEIPEDIRDGFSSPHTTSPRKTISGCRRPFRTTPTMPSPKPSTSATRPPATTLPTVYRLAYQQGCKGVTIYRDGSRDMQVLSVKKDDAKPEDTVPHEAAKKRVKRDRPRALTGSTYQMETGCGPLYVTINEDEAGLFELFTTMGKAGGCAASQCEAIGRLVSLAWRSGVQARQAVKQMIGITCHKPAGFGENRITSCADAVAKAIQMHMADHEDVDLAMPTTAAPARIAAARSNMKGVAASATCCGFSECA